MKNLEGDFVECGVNRGGLSRAVMHYVGFEELNKTFYLMDTFCGLVKEQISDAERACGIGVYESKYDECYEAVKQTFSAFENVAIVRGAIPETLAQVKTDRVCYLHIDMNCAEPEIAAAERVWD